MALMEIRTHDLLILSQAIYPTHSFFNIIGKSSTIVITDCRFSNEVAAIKNAGGVAIRVQRGPNPDWYDSAISYNRGPNGNSSWALSKMKLDNLKIHASEYSSIGLNYNCIIENNGTIDELHNKMYDIINSQSEGLLAAI